MAATVKELLMNMETTADLMDKPFSLRTDEEKMNIMKQGKPMPKVNKFISYKGKRMTILSLCNQEFWVAYSEHLDSIFCWACMLFNVMDVKQKCVISKLADKNFGPRIDYHKNSVFHLSSLLQYRMFMKQNPLCGDDLTREMRLESKDGRFRDILKLIINAVCLAVKQAPPFSKKVLNCYSIFNLQDCTIETLMFLGKIHKTDNTNSAISFIRNSPNVLKDTVEAISNVMKLAIKKEIESCSYVSLILSKHPGVDNYVKISAVIRYVYAGKVQERFIGFSHFAAGLSPVDIKEHVMEITSYYKLLGYKSSKLIALSTDGSVMPTSDLSNLISMLHRQSQSFFYVPCHFHDFSSILEQILISTVDCALFFNRLNAMKTFFQSNAGMFEAFTKVTKVKTLDLRTFSLNNLMFVRVVKLYRSEFIAFFKHIVQNPGNWHDETVTKAIVLEGVLKEYQMVFLLEAFNKLLNQIAILIEMLDTSSPENLFDTNILSVVKESLLKEKNEGFEKLWYKTITEMLEDNNPEEVEAIGQKQTDYLHILYLQIVDCMAKEINVRFQSAHKLEFLSTLNSEAHDKLLISDYQQTKLNLINVPKINANELITEMKILSKYGAYFGRKSVYELMDIIMKADLRSIFKNVYHLAELILAIPCKPVSPSHQTKTKLDVINSLEHFFNVFYPESKSLTFLVIERHYFEYLKSKIDFHDKVISNLQEINKDVGEKHGHLECKEPDIEI